MRLIAVSACTLLVGCGGLERQQYPAAADEALLVGTVKHVQPFEGDTSESGWSRLGWGTLAGGVIVGAAAGLAEPGEHSFDAYSYVVKPSGGRPQIINAFDSLEVGDCVAVYQSVREGMRSLSRLPPGRCDT
ncbi:hypothetical protein [Halomonas organivorans]|uniref:Uncharacterized protein n=1 Tax=Halomonas organivorans TaxID=257772 RepID=A0A7W5G654_9GAMM|nr:hypothetical protein [Halomonas organivorans]MBB3142188.1 hypothetical protein [Halomonas organivorans]